MRSAACVLAILLLLSLLALGCGGDEAVQKTPSPERATALVRDLYAIDGAIASGDGDIVAFDLRELLIVDLVLSVPGPEPSPARGGSTARAISGCTCDATGCNFTECRDDAPYAGWQMTGAISRADERVVFNISYTDLFSTWRLTGKVSLAPDRIDGALSFDEVIPDRGSDSAEIELHDVVVDDTKCPIGGTFRGDVDVDIAGRGHAGPVDYHVAGELAFGPTCQE